MEAYLEGDGGTEVKPGEVWMERRSDSCMCDRWTGERKEESGGDEADQERSPRLTILQDFLPFLSSTPPSRPSITEKHQMLNAEQHKMQECCFNGTSTPPPPHSLFYLTLVITTSLPLFISSSLPTLPPVVTHPRPPAPSPGNRAPNGNLAPGHIL